MNGEIGLFGRPAKAHIIQKCRQRGPIYQRRFSNGFSSMKTFGLLIKNIYCKCLWLVDFKPQHYGPMWSCQFRCGMWSSVAYHFLIYCTSRSPLFNEVLENFLSRDISKSIYRLRINTLYCELTLMLNFKANMSNLHVNTFISMKTEQTPSTKKKDCKMQL